LPFPFFLIHIFDPRPISSSPTSFPATPPEISLRPLPVFPPAVLRKSPLLVGQPPAAACVGYPLTCVCRSLVPLPTAVSVPTNLYFFSLSSTFFFLCSRTQPFSTVLKFVPEFFVLLPALGPFFFPCPPRRTLTLSWTAPFSTSATASPPFPEGLAACAPNPFFLYFFPPA